MKEEVGKAFGKYVPISKSGQVRFYLPLEKCADLSELNATGYEVPEES